MRVPAQSPVAGTPKAWKMFSARFLVRLCRIKQSQNISMKKFGPTALNFGYDSFPVVRFFGTPFTSPQAEILLLLGIIINDVSPISRS